MSSTENDHDRAAYLVAIDAAIIEADKGVFISGEKVIAWLRELTTNPDAERPQPDIFPEGYVVEEGTD